MEDTKDGASSAVGICFALGRELEVSHPWVQPHAITGYATLLWFTSKVHNVSVVDSRVIMLRRGRQTRFAYYSTQEAQN